MQAQSVSVLRPAEGFEPAALARMHFGKAQLFDSRRTRRLVKAAELIMAHPHGTLPKKLAARADLVGLYRLASRPEVTHGNVLEPHRQWTLQRMRQHAGVVLLVHDATELDYSSMEALADQLGQIGNGSRHGYLCHNSLALALDEQGRRQALGLASQILHKRRDVPRGEPLAVKRQRPDRQSRLWVRGRQQIGPASQGRLWVDVCDRGADTIEFLEYEVRDGRRLVIRLSKDRGLDGDDHVGADRIHRKLCSYVQDQPALGVRTPQVPAAGPAGRRWRSAALRCACGPGVSPAGGAGATRWTCGSCGCGRSTRRRASSRWNGCCGATCRPAALTRRRRRWTGMSIAR